MNIKNINIDIYRENAKKGYEWMQKQEGINNLTDAYIVIDLMKTGLEKAEPKLRKLKPTLCKIKEELNRKTMKEEEDEEEQ